MSYFRKNIEVTNTAGLDKPNSLFGRDNLNLYPLLLLFACAAIVIPLYVKEAIISTYTVFGAVTLAGLWFCRETVAKLGDPSLSILGTFWLIKLGMTLFLQSYGGWSALFDVNDYTPGDGYDAYRFYYDAQSLIENDWVPTIASNYQGAVYYYGVIFYLFGWNPFIPGFVNSFVTLLAILFLIRKLYELKGIQGPKDWKIAFLLLIPEFLSWDVQTSRESIAAALITTGILLAAQAIQNHHWAEKSRSLVALFMVLLSIAAVRTSMLLVLLAATFVMFFLLKNDKKNSIASKVILLGVVSGVVLMGPIVQTVTGGVTIQTIDLIQGGGVKTAEDDEWSENSIGRLLSPSNSFEAVLFTFPRALVYLVAPLPTINFTFAGLIEQERRSWHEMITAISSLVNVVLFPYLIAGVFYFARYRKHLRAPFVIIYVNMILIFLAIVGGNVIIHERYRLMVEPLYFAAVWMAYTMVPRNYVKRARLAWFCCVVLAVPMFFVYKSKDVLF